MASLNKLAVVFSGATDDNSDMVNGIFLFQGIKDDMPFYKNLVNQSYCYSVSYGIWYVNDKAKFEVSRASGYCASVDAGLGHPSYASQWKVSVDGKYEKRADVKVAIMVSPLFEEKPFFSFFKFYVLYRKIAFVVRVSPMLSR